MVDAYALQHNRPPGEAAAIRSMSARDWKLPAQAAVRAAAPMISAAPGLDGLKAGPATVVKDWRVLGPPRPELPGMVAMSVKFAGADPGVIEPVLSVGNPAEGTLLMVEHLQRGGLRFRVSKRGAVPHFSRAIPALDTRSSQRLVVSYGSTVAGRPAAGRYRVMMDGVMLEDIPWENRRYSFDEVVAGWNIEGNAGCLPGFAGSISGLEPGKSSEMDRGVWLPRIRARDLIELRLKFSKVTNSAEPITATGTDGLGDIVFVRRVAPGHVVFGHNHWGQEPELGPIVALDDDREHVLQVALGPLFAQSCAVVRPDCVRVVMDGRAVLDSRQVLYPFKLTEVCVLDNPLAGSFCGRDFLGDVDRSTTVSLEPLIQSVGAVLRENTGPISLTLRFDGSTTGRGLGLLEKGVSGAGDIVYVVVADRTHVRFFYDHWGYGGVTGRLVEIDPAKPHVLRISMRSLDPPGGSKAARDVADVATLDGQVVLAGKLPSASAIDGPIRLFDNALHSSNVSGPFDGTCLGVARGDASVSLAY
jgi:hypothetical protein